MVLWILQTYINYLPNLHKQSQTAQQDNVDHNMGIIVHWDREAIIPQGPDDVSTQLPSSHVSILVDRNIWCVYIVKWSKVAVGSTKPLIKSVF